MELPEIYADAAGETHYRSATIGFEQRSFAPPSPAIGVSAAQGAKSTVFLSLPPGWDDSFHPTRVTEQVRLALPQRLRGQGR